MNVIGSLRKQLSAFDGKGAADERLEVKVIENQRFNPATERWSFKNLLASDPKRYMERQRSLTFLFMGLFIHVLQMPFTHPHHCSLIRFSSEVGETDQFPTVPLPVGWEFSGLW